jgi:hypothetical protein
MRVDDFWVRSFECWDELWNVVDLSVVLHARSDFSKAERFIAIVATVLKVGSILQLLLRRKLEKLLANGELTVDRFLAESEIRDIEEPW